MSKKEDLIEIVRTEVRELAHLGLGEGSPYFDTAVLLLASAVVGCSVRELASFTGFSQRFIGPRALRLQQAGTWRGDRVNADWEDADSGDTTFLLGVLIAEGVVIPAKDVQR